MFGDGHLAACKPISEEDLAKFMGDCITQSDKVNQARPCTSLQCSPASACSLNRSVALLYPPDALALGSALSTARLISKDIIPLVWFCSQQKIMQISTLECRYYL